MTAAWNPSDPSRIGLEFQPTSHGSRGLSSDSGCVVQTMRCTAGDTIDRVRPYLRVDRPGGVCCEVYGAGSEIAGAQTTAVYLPTADYTSSGFTGPAGETTNLWGWIDDTNPRLSTTGGAHPDFLVANGGTAQAYYYARLGGLAGALTGRRILAVTVVAIVSGYPGYPAPWSHLSLVMGGQVWFPGAGQYLAADREQLIALYLTTNPATGRSWLLSELQALSSGGNGIGIQFGYGATGPSAAVLATLGLEVTHCAENRLAFGSADAAATGWLDIPLVTPAGVTSLARSGGTDYSVVLHRRHEPVNVPAPFLGAVPEWKAVALPEATGFLSPTGNAGWAHYPAPVSDGNWAISSLGLPDQTVWPVTMRRTSTLTAPDGQPYHSPLLARVDATMAARQGLRATGAGTLGVVRVGARPLTNGPLGSLLVQVRRTSDNAAIGGVGTLTRALWDAEPADGSISNRPIKYVDVALASSGSISGATAYYVEVTAPTCTGVTNVNGRDSWELVALAGVPHGVSGYGGTTDVFTWPVGTTWPDADAPVQALTQPTAPTSLTVTTVTDALGDDGTSCAMTTIGHGRLVWPATALGAAFARYEIQRQEASISSDWYTIGRLTVENPAGGPGFTDYEARRNVATTYRVRVIRTDGGFSPWRAGNVAQTFTMAGCQLVLTSNELPSVVARNDVGPRNWEFLGAGEWKFMELYGRDYQVAFRSVAERGFRWSFDLLMYGRGDQATAPPATQNWEQFEVLEAWSAFGVATVALLTEAGQRAWGVVRLLSGVRDDNAGHVYRARVEFTQTGDDPVVVERVSS